MWASLKTLFTPPQFEDSDKTRVAARLHTILLALLLMSLVLSAFYAVLDFQQRDISILITLSTAVLFLTSLGLLNRGHYRLTSWILILFMYATIIVIAHNFDGIHDTSLTGYFLLITVVGLLLGAKEAFITATLCAFALVFVYSLDVLDGGVTAPTQPPFLKVMEMGALLLVLGLVLRMTIDHLNQALQRTQREVAEREAAQAALAEARHRLEERVEARTAELRQANRDLQTLIESNQDGILFLTDEERLAVINSRALELLQVKGESSRWQQRSLSELLQALRQHDPEATADVRATLTRIAKRPHAAQAKQGNGEEPPGAGNLEGELDLRPYHLHWYSVATTIGKNTPAHLVVLRDITRQRQAEQMRNDLISTMVHDLRNPLSTMLSMLSTLTWLDQEGRDTLSARQQRYVGQSIESVRQMNQLVSNILDVGRLESDQMPLHQSAIPVEALLSQIVEAQKPLAQAKQLSLQYQVPSTVPPAWADASLLERIVQNLLDNAIKFTPGGGRVLVTAQPWDGNGSGVAAVQIAVSDTGPGIPPELEPDLFGKFVAGNQEGSGSGLGLAFCKLAVEAHGGKMWTENQPGMGATFAFTLPVARRSESRQ